MLALSFIEKLLKVSKMMNVKLGSFLSSKDMGGIAYDSYK